ncbi:hypothetical protein HAX54_029449, partial [Datura stramonium]|nr:hypothetical protein [Datura stramonium]
MGTNFGYYRRKKKRVAREVKDSTLPNGIHQETLDSVQEMKLHHFLAVAWCPELPDERLSIIEYVYRYLDMNGSCL